VTHTFIADLASEVPIPDDGTLSRVLHSDERIRVVAFAFDQGQELTEHTAALPVVLQVVQGSLELTVDDETVTLTPGGWLRLDASIPHSVRASKPSVLLLTMLKG
jgi:quercetin dioxygenase-like cupin family protein